MTNPWENISFGSQRRIETESSFDYFWIADASGNYGFFVQTGKELPHTDGLLRLKGINIISRNSSTGKGELILILNSNSEWELFLKICSDLIKASEVAANEELMIKGVFSRLKKWQSFLMQRKSTSLTMNEQMGLFTELDCLLNYIIPNLSKEQAMTSWTGADFDKQDFSIDQKLIEVKSYISSKGAFIAISSLHQLDNTKKPLYLLIYGLTVFVAGLSVVDLIETIERLLSDSPENLEHFQEKVAMYGYINGVTEPPFHRFKVDRHIAFYVSDSFPKLTSVNVPTEINSINYTLDILKCLKYKTEIKPIFES